MTPEQLLIIAREFCAHHRGVRIINFAALCAAAAASTARIEGISVHGDTAQAAECLESTLLNLAPLSSANAEFARVCSLVMQMR